MQPKASSKARITGIAAPPETHTRSGDTSYASRLGTRSSAPYIVGTPATPGQDLQRLGRVEAGEQGQARAGRHDGVERAGLPEGVEQRQTAEDDVVGGEPKQVGGDHLGVAGKVGVGEFGTLRLAGGAGGVQDDHSVVRPPFHHVGGRLRTRLHNVGECGRIDDDRSGLGPCLAPACASSAQPCQTNASPAPESRR